MSAVCDILLPNSRASVTFSSPKGDEAAIARASKLFLNVWSNIPPSDRADIERMWAAIEDQRPPRVVLDDPWFGGDENMASCELCGELLKFDWPTITLMPDHTVEATIAHEMAHVYQWAIGKHRYNLLDSDLTGAVKDIFLPSLTESGRVELHADEVMIRWGFDRIAATAWLIQFTRPENGVVTLREKPVTTKYARSEARARRWRRYHCCDGRVNIPRSDGVSERMAFPRSQAEPGNEKSGAGE